MKTKNSSLRRSGRWFAVAGCLVGTVLFAASRARASGGGSPPPPSPLTVTTTTTANCAGGGIRFDVRICNTGTAALQDVKVTNTLPIGLTFAPNSVSAVDGANNAVPVSLCEPQAGQMIKICLGSALAAGQCVTVRFSATFAEALCNHVVVTGSGPPVSQGDEGCSPGFWKNHFAAWAPSGFSPGDDFDTVFGVNAFTPDRTLEQAVNQGGGGVKALGRHAVAALLNAGHGGIDYGMTVAQVRQTVQAALAAGGNIEAAKNALAALNELGCPLGSGNGGNGGGSAPVVFASDTTCLDSLLNALVTEFCTPCPPPQACDYVTLIRTFCLSSLPDACGGEIGPMFDCFSAFETATIDEIIGAEITIVQQRCQQLEDEFHCCADNPATDLCDLCAAVGGE